MKMAFSKPSAWLAGWLSLCIFLPGFNPGLFAQSANPDNHCRKFIASAYHLASDQTLILQEDLFLYCKGDVRIDGKIRGQKIENSNADGQNLSIRAEGDIIINGDIWLSDGGDGQMVPVTTTPHAPLLISNVLGSRLYTGKTFKLDICNGGKGGSLILEGRRIIIRGKIRVGNGGNGVASGNGGDGGDFFLESQRLLGNSSLLAGNGGNGGEGTSWSPSGGDGGNGGQINLFTCADGNAGTNGNNSIPAVLIPPMPAQPAQNGTDGGVGGTDNDGIACNGGKGGDGGNSSVIGLGGGHGGMGGNGGQATNTTAGGDAAGGNGGDGGKGGNATVSLAGGNGGKGGNGGNGIGANGVTGGTCAAAKGGAGNGGKGGNGGNGGNGTAGVFAGNGGNGGNGGTGTGGNAGTCIALSCSTPTGGVGTGGAAGTGGTHGTGIIGLGVSDGTNGTNGTQTNGSSGTCTLPIELLHFQASKNATQVQLNWSTATETNNDYMAVERSADGVHFIEIGRRKGQGTTTETQYYTLVDEHPLQGNNYYRLRQVDFDQTTDHSKVIALHFERGQVLSLFPNPAHDKVFLQTPLNLSAGQVYLLDALGKKFAPVLEGAMGWYELTLPNHLPKGHYWVIIQHEKEVLQTLLIKE